MFNKYKPKTGKYGTEMTTGDYTVPSLGSQNYKFTTNRDWEEAAWLMNYAYDKGRKDKLAEVLAE